jgi:hypothetical protein
MELESTRALACSDRRPRRSEEDVVPSLIRIFHAHFDANVRSACSAGFQACCVADFQVGRVSDAAGRQRVWKRYMNAHKTSVIPDRLVKRHKCRAPACPPKPWQRRARGLQPEYFTPAVTQTGGTLVAQASKPAVSPTSKSAGCRMGRSVGGFGNPRYSRLGSLRYAKRANIQVSLLQRQTSDGRCQFICAF